MADKDKDVKLGTAAEKPAELSTLDHDRYYTPPGATEPVLRPEFANAPTEEPAAEETKAKSTSKAGHKK